MGYFAFLSIFGTCLSAHVQPALLLPRNGVRPRLQGEELLGVEAVPRARAARRRAAGRHGRQQERATGRQELRAQGRKSASDRGRGQIFLPFPQNVGRIGSIRSSSRPSGALYPSEPL